MTTAPRPSFFAAALALTLLTPALALAQTIIVDDMDGAPTFTLTGSNWTTWGSNGYGFDGSDSQYHYLSHTVGGPGRRGTATWSPDLPVAGTWAISTWWRRTENRTDDADHFISDGLGGLTHLIIDQQGDGASGWVDLGQYVCAAGPAGCSVLLDGTDDDQSDAANAVRFVLVAADPGAGPTPASPCDAPSVPGVATQEGFAGTTSASGWSNAAAAVGAANGTEASTPNVDAGEALGASGFDLCDPTGPETITAVELAVRARTQYATGQYRLDLQLDGGGAASRQFTGTSLQWRALDVTADRSSWTFADVQALAATVSLGAQPGGNRDSDAWVDAFRVTVTYLVPDPPEEPTPEEPGAQPPDGDEPPEEEPQEEPEEDAPTEDAGSGEPDDDDSAAAPEEGGVGLLLAEPAPGVAPAPGCGQVLDGGVGLGLLGLVSVFGALRVPHRRRPGAPRERA